MPQLIMRRIYKIVRQNLQGELMSQCHRQLPAALVKVYQPGVPTLPVVGLLAAYDNSCLPISRARLSVDLEVWEGVGRVAEVQPRAVPNLLGELHGLEVKLTAFWEDRSFPPPGSWEEDHMWPVSLGTLWLEEVTLISRVRPTTWSLPYRSRLAHRN